MAASSRPETQSHPELAIEQSFLDHAHRRLEETREEAIRLRHMVEVGQGGTNQARWEREVINQNIATRLTQLDIGNRSLCFGRIDFDEENDGGSYHIGRTAVADANAEPLIVDWRAKAAEPFYRATGRQPFGLVRRRHFTSRGTELLGIEDEFFGDAATASSVVVNGVELRGEGALVSALNTARSGRLSDIVGTIQGEQDEIIRAPIAGVMVVQGGPGTGKTVVALHRAAYLLYSHRFPLETQGVLVVGPNRLFLGYIEQVLPSLGESGVELSVLADLIPNVRVQGRDVPAAARIKGDLRMVNLVRRAVKDRQRPLTSDLIVGMGIRKLRVRTSETEQIVREARRRFNTHNSARKYVRTSLFEALAASHPDDPGVDAVTEATSHLLEIREALDRMWPLLSPGQLLHDLYGSKALIRSAGRRLSDAEQGALFRPWREDWLARKVLWTVDDVPVLDEAIEILGPLPKQKREGYEEVRTYGHIVVDEAQDLSPMQLRVLTRRSLNGSMTVVGDIAQSTGAWAHQDWDEVLDHLPDRKPPQRAELTVGYRIPGPLMDLAAKLLPVAAPHLKPPVSVRSDGDDPRFEAVADHYSLLQNTVRVAVEESEALGSGNVAVITPGSLFDAVCDEFEAQNVEVGRAPRDGLSHPITIVPVGLVKGLEVDTAVVVEPAAILEEEAQGARALYVALTRTTQRLALVHARPIPEIIVGPDSVGSDDAGSEIAVSDTDQGRLF